jgi:hypothetical protein
LSGTSKTPEDNVIHLITPGLEVSLGCLILRRRPVFYDSYIDPNLNWDLYGYITSSEPRSKKNLVQGPQGIPLSPAEQEQSISSVTLNGVLLDCSQADAHAYLQRID